MAHMFLISRPQVKELAGLFARSVDGDFFIIEKGNGFADIAQYVKKYDNIKIVCVREDSLLPFKKSSK